MPTHLNHREFTCSWTASLRGRCLRRMRRFSPRPLAAALAASSLLTLPVVTTGVVHAQTLPSGLSVANGQAQVQTIGNQMTVTNTANAILNWNAFNIATGAGVHFQQPSAASKVLNRVVGSDPSNIFGNLTSNGQVWLVNPNGVLFGQGARVDVSGLVVSTLRLNDQDFLAGQGLFGSPGGATGGSLVNQGELRTHLGGRVLLVGGQVRNEGLIDSPAGQVGAAVARTVEFVDTSTPNLRIKVADPEGLVANTGRMAAAGGHINLFGSLIQQDGAVTASGASGGGITLDAGAGRLTLQGSIDARGDGADGIGGTVQLLGKEVGLLGTSTVDASGTRAGGQVFVGGGLRGADPRFSNARAVYVGPDATIRADALGNGNGGSIVLWSNNSTRAFGRFSARGGATGGDGGFIETSGGWLDARPAAMDVSSRLGRSGSWLLDPFDIVIGDGLATGGGLLPNYVSGGVSSQINTADIVAALNAGTNVTIATGAGGAGLGDITLVGNINLNTALPTSLRLEAHGSIIISGRIDSFGFPNRSRLDVSLLAAKGGIGRIQISGSISTDKGSITIGGFGAPGQESQFGSEFGAAISNTALPAIDISGTLYTNDSGGGIYLNGLNIAGGPGVSLATSATLQSAVIDIFGKSSGSDLSTSVGVLVNGSQLSHRYLRDIGVGLAAGVRANGQPWNFSVSPYFIGNPRGTDLIIQGIANGQSGSGIGVEVRGATTGDGVPTIGGFNVDRVLISGSVSPSAGSTAVLLSSATSGSASQNAVAANLRFADVGSVRILGSGGKVELDGIKISFPSAASSAAQSIEIDAPAISFFFSQIHNDKTITLRAEEHAYGASTRLIGSTVGLHPSVYITGSTADYASSVLSAAGPLLVDAQSPFTIAVQKPDQLDLRGLLPQAYIAGSSCVFNCGVAVNGDNRFVRFGDQLVIQSSDVITKIYDGTATITPRETLIYPG